MKAIAEKYDIKAAIAFKAAFDSLRKDREGEVKITFSVPLSDEESARRVPIQKELLILIARKK